MSVTIALVERPTQVVNLLPKQTPVIQLKEA